MIAPLYWKLYLIGWFQVLANPIIRMECVNAFDAKELRNQNGNREEVPDVVEFIAFDEEFDNFKYFS